MEHDLAKRERLVFFGLVSTACSLIPTGYAAFVSNSTVLFTDLLRCIAEFIAILVSWLVVRQVARHDRSTFNFGFGKLEQLSVVSVAAALLFGFLLAITSAIHRFVWPEPLEGTRFGLIFGFLSILGNAVLWGLHWWQGRSNSSPLSESQARLFRAKTFATGVVAFSLLFSEIFRTHHWAQFIDPLGAFFLALFLLHSAYSMLVSSVPDLVDQAVDEKVQRIIMQALIHHERLYSGLEGVRTRRAGATRIQVEIFLAFSGEQTIRSISEVATVIERDIVERLPGSMVTIIPLATKVS